MKKLSISLLSLCLLNTAIASPTIQLKTEKDKVSYGIGFDLGRTFTKQGIELDSNIFLLGLEDGRQNKTPLMTEVQIKETIMSLQNKLIKQQQEAMKKISDLNLAEGKAFLQKNKGVSGVKTLSSGLQYRVLVEGTGPIPTAKDTVKVHYKGMLLNKTEFDSSSQGPVEFPVTGIIKGWTEALQLMKTGSKWELVIPANLAYGDKGAGNIIGPNATLLFEVELLGITTPGKNSVPAKGSASTKNSAKKSTKQ